MSLESELKLIPETHPVHARESNPSLARGPITISCAQGLLRSVLPRKNQTI